MIPGFLISKRRNSMATYIPKTIQKPLLRQILTTHIPETTKEIGELKVQRKLHCNRGRHKKERSLDRELTFQGWVRKYPNRSWPAREKKK